MPKSERLIKSVSRVLSEELGEQTDELFYTSYQNKDITDIIKDSRALLAELVGPVVAIKKITEASQDEDKSEK